MLPLKVMCPISVQALTNLSPPRLFTIHPRHDDVAPVIQAAEVQCGDDPGAEKRQQRADAKTKQGGRFKYVCFTYGFVVPT